MIRSMAKRNITICLGSSCFSRGNNLNLELVKRYLADNGLTDVVGFAGRLCENRCDKGPVICIDDHVYYEVNASRLHKILKEEFPC